MIFDFGFKHDPATSALVVVDMQNNYVGGKEYGLSRYLEHLSPGSTDYYFGMLDSQVFPNIRRLLDHFHAQRIPVIYLINSIETPDASDINPILREQMLQAERRTGVKRIFPIGTFEAEINELVAPVLGDQVIHKKSQGAFGASTIDTVLRSRGIQSLFFSGVVTEGCVESTARGAFNQGYKTVVIEDACTTITQQAHDAAIRAFGSMCGQVMATDSVLGLFSQTR